MAKIELRERLSLDSPPDRVWAFLTDPRKTVVCLPGAEITGQRDEHTFDGAVNVKVGAVRIAYRGTAVFEDLDEARRYVRVVGKGREKTGSGSAEMTMESTVAPTDGGGSEVTIDAEVRITGKMVRFGRGMIQTVAAELLEEFRTRLAAELETASAESEEAALTQLSAGHDEAISLVSLLFRALRSWLLKAFGRS